MNREAYATLYTLLALDGVLFFLLARFSTHLDTIDRLYIYTSLALHVCIYYGLIFQNHTLIYIAHVGYALYVITAPFLVRTFLGKCIYTALIALQFMLLILHNNCVITHIHFHDKDTEPHHIFPPSITVPMYFTIQILLLITIWTL